MASKPWAVVLFENENSVATVPDIWLTKIDCMDVTLWPTHSKNISNKVKRRDEPREDWSKFICKILGFYDQYETALKKSLLAENKLELTSTSDESQKRKRKINKKYKLGSSSSDSDEYSEPSEYDSDKYPKFPKKLTEVIDEEEFHSDKVDSCDGEKNTIFKKKHMGHTKILYTPSPSTPTLTGSLLDNSHVRSRSATPSHQEEQTGSPQCAPITPSTFTGGLPNSYMRSRLATPSQNQQTRSPQCAPISLPISSDSDFKRQIFNKLNIITAKLTHHDECFDSLKILIEKQHYDNEMDISGESCDHLLPLSTEEDVMNLNEILKSVDNCKRLAKELSLIGGDSPEELTKKIMYRIISSELAQLYSWEGGKGKRKFCELSLSKVIFDAVRLNKRTQNACEDEIIKAIKKFLVKAKERVTNKQKRTQSTTTCDLSTFPSTFKFGAGTAAYQVEGGWNEDGKSRSWWDWFTNNYPQYTQNSTGNVACDSYHKYKEDVAAMKAMGLQFYRFSLSWSRILPKGFSYSVNQAGVDYYNKLLDELEEAGIEPLVTIYHWDTPMALEHLGTTWTNPKIVDQFLAFADLAFSLFGDRVKLWATINEPKSFCQAIPGYFLTYIFPELPIGTLEYLCGHHVLLAHAKTYRLYQEKYKSTQNGKISITLDLNYNMPLTNSTADLEAAERRNTFEFGWFAHPLYHGDYPSIMKTVIANNSANQNFTVSRLPKFSCTEKLMIKGSYDLFMINSYTGTQVTMKEYNNEPAYINDEQTSATQPDHWLGTAVSNLKVYPEGIRYVLKYVKETYGNPEIMITENGYSDTTGNVNDTLRIEFIQETLRNIRLAMCEDAVNVTRYTYWSLLDNLEWARGYGVKFGLIQVDFDSENRTRTLKRSAYYYKNVILNRSINVTDSTA